MRPMLLILAIVGTVGCASQGEPAAAPRVAATNTVATGAPVQAVPAAAAPKAEAKIKAPSGYKAVERSGQVLYCQKVKVTGSNLASEVCMTPAEYAQLKQQADADRQKLKQNSSICAGGRCGGA